ncbi:hypothetical protein HN419_03155 [Candidatus Woesearchaeota archaeon]|nr:hypothetical protein [Candidatus Woesearchaeota archaeon]MBT7929972.1 hypothetical protein [Candidatus Peregrinibacteria bacterium]MBT3537005.1 hypothetical protein [Candidatus Woesearchaeota archaeon]MBT4697615.1 hypothetical protein [Candidatus Woesearchaeota archaeon]MBT7106685.1 hypothetical protein [Candidatus Woesearchaeota archaeon]
MNFINDNNHAFYLVMIVSIVAIVGIFIIVSRGPNTLEKDIAGEATRAITGEIIKKPLMTHVNDAWIYSNMEVLELGKTVKIHRTNVLFKKKLTPEIKKIRDAKATRFVRIPKFMICLNNICNNYKLSDKIVIEEITYTLSSTDNKIRLISNNIDDWDILPQIATQIFEQTETHNIPVIEPAGHFKTYIEENVDQRVPKYLQVGIIVDDTDYTITDEEIEDFISLMDKELSKKTNINVKLHGIRHTNFGITADNYYNENNDNPPDYVIIFRSNTISLSYGGYAITSSNLIEEGYCNNFVSPYQSANLIWGAVIDWTHIYSGCGYDLEHYKSTGELNHISNVSLDDGSCKNQAGIACVFNDIVEYYACSNKDPSHPYLQSKMSFLAFVAIHELLHHFGNTHNYDHFGTDTCDDIMGSEDYKQSWNHLSSFGMCPYTIDNLATSYNYLRICS